ncbi:hypothetical protein MKK70_27320 [Methylobacterium sp. E-041]|uniref:hypothetical protein n=1 Tax=Methylobacterium sp. E-041 TaxID=2836573 RepID=UPI001FBA64B5|nr:hypothetical protein [Methylobacterium sp. E-041]MCJ2109012.1 hypothetical protein [Methylobacterium sp. E-041]
MIRRAHSAEPGDADLHLATGIQCLADAQLMAAAPDLAGILLGLLTTLSLRAADLDPHTRARVDAAWILLVRAAPHLEI